MTKTEEIDYIANALIEAKTNYGYSQITKTQLKAYRLALFAKYQSAFSFFEQPIDYIRKNYGKFITIISEDKRDIYYSINDDVTVSDLWNEFRNYLSCPYMLAFADKECVECIDKPELLEEIKERYSNPNLEVKITFINCEEGKSLDYKQLPGLTFWDIEALEKIDITEDNIRNYLKFLNNGYNYEVSQVAQNNDTGAKTFVIASAKKKEMTRTLA